MRFRLAFGYFIKRNGGFSNLLLLTVCQLIPVVGPIVAGGYRAEVAMALIHDPEMLRHPKFDFNRFVEYLNRGIWPFLIALLLGLLIVVPALAAFGAGFAVAAAVNDPQVGFATGVVIFIIGWLVVMMLSLPMTLHAELVNRFDFGGGLHFAFQFWALVGGPAIVTGIIFLPLAFVVTLIGLLCCCVGIYPANTLTLMAAQHLMVQLYREYLDRGGEPIVEYRRRARREEEADEWDDEYRDRDS